jgi:hypothetical protein
MSNLRELRIRHSEVLDVIPGGSLALEELVLEGTNFKGCRTLALCW